MQSRPRFSTDEIAQKLTYSDYLNMHLEEPIVLHRCLERHTYLHWFEHYHSLARYVNGDPPTYHVREAFDELTLIISDGLRRSGFIKEAQEILECSSEDELNQLIIRQYTDDTALYKTTNQVLRDCHRFQDFDAVADSESDSPLAAWVLQLNACIRKLPHFEGIAYRGTWLSAEDISQYNVGDMLIWAPFVSASKNRDRCFGGNVLFEIHNGEHFMGLNDKAYPREVFMHSIFPEEEEIWNCNNKLDIQLSCNILFI